jgi:hypothetical protein
MDRDNLPDAFEVDSQVVVHQHILEAGDGPLVDFGVGSLQIFADPLSGFGEHLEVAQNRILNEFGPTKAVLAVRTKPPDSLDGVEDVMDVKTVVLHKRIAS